MIVVRIVMLCVAAALMCLTLRAQRPESALLIALAAGIAALTMALEPVCETVRALSDIAQRAGMEGDGYALTLRAAGIAMLAEFGAQLCRDAGEGALAMRVEFGARAALLCMSVPLMARLLDTLTELIA